MASDTSEASANTLRMVRVDYGSFSRGTHEDTSFPADGEGPVHEVTVGPFYIDRHAVKNDEFFEFVRETTTPRCRTLRLVVHLPTLPGRRSPRAGDPECRRNSLVARR